MKTPVRATSDVLIVGGGIFGQFAALRLARVGKAVTLLDRGGLWSEASSVNAGSLGIQNKLPALVPYTLWAWQRWAGMAEEFGADVGVRRNGGYKIALTEAEAERLDEIAEEQRRAGLPVRRVSAAELRSEAPWLSDEVRLATHSELDGYASPTLLGPVLRRRLVELGVEIVEGATVQSVTQAGGPIVSTDKGEFRCRTLAVTAGVWSSGIAAMVGVRLPVSLDVNMVTVTDRAPAGTMPQLVTHARGILTLKQVANGSCLIGGGWQGIGTLDDRRKDVDFDQIIHNLRLAMRAVPGLRDLNVLRSWAGYEGVTPDSLPYLGRLPGHPDIYCAACARGGFTLGPLMGDLLGELMLTGETSRPIDAFDPGRFHTARSSKVPPTSTVSAPLEAMAG